ncbi:MAG: hypothetical protein EP335_11545 [Alphaproteobacteria bacterium]|nr:MAG: hypothetical protein EP335_11545 [Alphaproteobacteria bacterium]
MPISAAFADDLMVADNGLSAGYATLAWPDAAGETFLLEREADSGWTAVYDGPDHATTLSGLHNGTYRFRLSADDGMPGDVLEITVAHHPLSRAWMFFGIGAVMFAGLLGLLAAGTRRPVPASGEDATR